MYESIHLMVTLVLLVLNIAGQIWYAGAPARHKDTIRDANLALHGALFVSSVLLVIFANCP